jgi:hypothetical protein
MEEVDQFHVPVYFGVNSFAVDGHIKQDLG